MVDYVVDTNVLLFSDKFVKDINSESELACMAKCQDWLNSFWESENRLVVDHAFKILGEYYSNIAALAPDQNADHWLRQFVDHPFSLVYLIIRFDRHGYAELPEDFQTIDRSDRKFVAVALEHSPRPPIVRASDRGWDNNRKLLETVSVIITDACSNMPRTKQSRYASSATTAQNQ